VSALIELDQITKSYNMPGGDVHALRGVTLTIDRGEFVSVVGSSGSGKTTLLYVLGLLTSPTHGAYSLSGRPVGGLSDQQLSSIRGTEVGFVFQSFHLVPQLAVIDNVMLAARYCPGTDGAALRRRAQGLVEQVGLGARIGHRPGELSGGEMQRVAIARALLTEPQLILADEPTGNLDESTGDQIFSLLQSLGERGCTVVLVTHDLALAGRTQRQIRLKDGEVFDEAA
jgi:putative ABC transport system ATP-binding protein